jgi:hypothetical protein
MEDEKMLECHMSIRLLTKTKVHFWEPNVFSMTVNVCKVMYNNCDNLKPEKENHTFKLYEIYLSTSSRLLH